MRPPRNRRVFVDGYGAATPLGGPSPGPGSGPFAARRASGFITRCPVDAASKVVGEIPDWDPRRTASPAPRRFTTGTPPSYCSPGPLQGCPRGCGPGHGCREGAADGLPRRVGPKRDRRPPGCVEQLAERGPLRVSPYLLPNLCANLPSGKAGILLGFTGHVFSPQGPARRETTPSASGPDDPGRGLRFRPLPEA
jgi:3-oxoacyl-[acyl-carrier-protein] synthase II